MYKIFCGHLSGIDVIDQNTPELLARHVPVNQDSRYTDAQSPRESGLATETRSDDKSFDIVADHRFHKVRQFLRALLGTGEDDGIAILIGYILYVSTDFGVEWISDV